MATYRSLALAIATIFLLCGASAQGQASSPESFSMGPSSGAEAPTPDCMTNLLNMSDCLSYVTAGSNETKPDKACCPELAGLVDSSPQCLCYLFDKNTTASYGISIDMAKALKLPLACGVSTPPASLCSVITGDQPMSPDDGVAAASPSSGNKDKNGATSISLSALTWNLALSFSFLPIFFHII